MCHPYIKPFISYWWGTSDQIKTIHWRDSRRGDIADTLCHSEHQANVPFAHLVRIGLSSLVHSFGLSGQHFAWRHIRAKNK